MLRRPEGKLPAQTSLQVAMVEIHVEDNGPRLCLKGITGFGDSQLVFPFVFSCLPGIPVREAQSLQFPS